MLAFPVCHFGGSGAPPEPPTGWSLGAQPYAGAGYFCVAHNGTDLFAAGGANAGEAVLVTSATGASWDAQTLPNAAANDRVESICFGNSLWVAGTFQGKVYTSPDGTNWTERSTAFGATPILDVIWSSGASKFVAIGNSTGTDSIQSSADGITWALESNNIPAGRILHAIAFDETSRYVIAGADSATDTDPRVFTATSLSTWSEFALGFDGDGACLCTRWSSDINKFICTRNTKIWSSANGSVWNDDFTSADISLLDGISIGGGYWIVGGAGGGFTGRIVQSTDGANWSDFDSGLGWIGSILDACFGGVAHILVGSQVIAVFVP